MPPRKVIAIACGEALSADDLNLSFKVLIALCDDGTMWRKNISLNDPWVQYENVPQPEV